MCLCVRKREIEWYSYTYKLLQFLWKSPLIKGSREAELKAIVGISTERPDRKGNQLGGYGVVWTDEELPSLYGHYDGPFNNTGIFILKVIKRKKGRERQSTKEMLFIETCPICCYCIHF